MSANELHTEKDIESAFHEAIQCFPPPAGLEAAIADRLGRIRASQAAARAPASTRAKSNRKRTFVKILKWAMPSAAACAAAAMLILSLLPGPAAVQSAYGEVTEAIQKSRSAEWVHYVSFDGQMQTWISLKPYCIIQKPAKGGVIFDDGESFKQLRYDPEQNTIRIQDTMLESDAKEFASVLDYVMSAINEDKARGAPFERSHSTVNGKRCTVYYVKNADRSKWKKLAVDIDTKQIVRFEILEHGQQVAMDFDYPKSGPQDIYALGVPRDAKIVDVRTRDDHSNRMLANAQKAERQFDTSFRAISCYGPLDRKTGKMVVNRIIVYYQTPHQRRIDWWGVSKPKEQVNPDSTEDLEKYTRTHSPSAVDMTVPGGGGVFYNLSSPRQIRKSVNMSGQPARFQRILWKTNRRQYGRAVPDQKGANGPLQGTQRIEPAGVSDGVVHSLPTRWTIYLNPQRDYIVEKSEEWRSLDESWVPRDGLDGTAVLHKHVREPKKTTTTVLEYARTAGTPLGHWYAKRYLIERDSQGRRETFMRVNHVDTKYKFPDGLFSPTHFEAQQKRPVKGN